MLVQYDLNNMHLTSSEQYLGFVISFWLVLRIFASAEKRQLLFSLVNSVSRLVILFPAQSP